MNTRFWWLGAPDFEGLETLSEPLSEPDRAEPSGGEAGRASHGLRSAEREAALGWRFAMEQLSERGPVALPGVQHVRGVVNQG